MAILILKDGKRYQECCSICKGIHLYDLKERGTYSEMGRYACPDCGYKTVAPLLELLRESADTPSIPKADTGE